MTVASALGLQQHLVHAMLFIHAQRLADLFGAAYTRTDHAGGGIAEPGLDHLVGAAHGFFVGIPDAAAARLVLAENVIVADGVGKEVAAVAVHLDRPLARGPAHH